MVEKNSPLFDRSRLPVAYGLANPAHTQTVTPRRSWELHTLAYLKRVPGPKTQDSAVGLPLKVQPQKLQPLLRRTEFKAEYDAKPCLEGSYSPLHACASHKPRASCSTLMRRLALNLFNASCSVSRPACAIFVATSLINTSLGQTAASCTREDARSCRENHNSTSECLVFPDK